MGTGSSKSDFGVGCCTNGTEVVTGTTGPTFGIRVSLNVYKLRGKKPRRRSFNDKVGLGIYHTGVEVYGKEWSYGGQLDCAPGRCGIFACPPRRALPLFVESIPLGMLPPETSEKVIFAVLNDMRPKWDACAYHLFRRNCNHFTQAFRDALCAKLPHVKLKEIPSFINRAARAAAALVPDVFYRRVMRRSLPKTPQAPANGPVRNSEPKSDAVPAIPIPSDIEVLRGMSVRELKTMMWVNGISWAGCIEKEDLILAIRESKK